jgi:uroporphyrinogen decarboxylase
MRQAGRSLPQYRAIRQHSDLFAICRRPELCADVTLQPVEALGVDAAVIYSDIMLPVLGMGIDVELVEGVGPVVHEPLRRPEDVKRLRPLEPEVDLPFALESIRLVREALAPEKAVVGFVGGPFTVAGYLLEGRPSRTFLETKRCMYASPRVWHALMERLAEAFAGYAAAQIAAGADLVQLFDSWAGVLSVDDYREFVAPYSARILAAADVPTIHFGTACIHLLSDLAATGADVIGLDWRLRIDLAWELVGSGRGIQGNLDPTVLLGPFARVEAETAKILDAVGGRPGHIFNLGHGVLPETEPSALRRLRELVHERTDTGAGQSVS